jgi:hypothetical protein
MLRPHPKQTVVLKFPFRVFHLLLLWFWVTAMMRFLFRVLRFLVFPPLPFLFFALDLPCRLVADALLGMVDIDLHLPLDLLFISWFRGCL